MRTPARPTLPPAPAELEALAFEHRDRWVRSVYGGVEVHLPAAGERPETRAHFARFPDGRFRLAAISARATRRAQWLTDHSWARVSDALDDALRDFETGG